MRLCLLRRSKLFVGGLSFKTTDRTAFYWDAYFLESLERYFSHFGKIKQANVMKYTDRQVSRGFGFCIFENPESAELAMQTTVHIIDGRKVRVHVCSINFRWMCVGHYPRKWLLLHRLRVHAD